MRILDIFQVSEYDGLNRIKFTPFRLCLSYTSQKTLLRAVENHHISLPMSFIRDNSKLSSVLEETQGGKKNVCKNNYISARKAEEIILSISSMCHKHLFKYKGLAKNFSRWCD